MEKNKKWTKENDIACFELDTQRDASSILN
jgi:hypothetical protein